MPTIRRATIDDAKSICAVHVASIRGVCADHYSPEQIELWAGGKTPHRYHRSIMEDVVYVAEDDGTIIGLAMMSLEHGEVQAVYVHPDHLGRGVGAQLVGALEESARAGGLDTLTLHASLNSIGFYERMGFTNNGSTTMDLRTGLPLECVRMSKDLSNDATR